MKKKISLLCLFILGLLLVPRLVLADEIPKTGVHYFVTYPNGEEFITKSYDEAMSQEEKLIYSGLTSSDGQVVLEGLLNQGTLRIVQKVPNGYSTDTTEIKLDLSQGTNNVEFVDYKGSNPNTGQSILFIVGVIAVLVIAFAVAKKDHKKLFILPLFVVGALLLQVKADNDNLVITIKDKAGNKLAGVEVEVYATPVIDYGPAVTFSANGGKFFDGTTEMIYRLPSPNCTWDDFEDTLDENEYNYVTYNFWGSYREGYVFANGQIPESLTDDTVINVVWEADDEIEYYRLHANGGIYDFYGHPLETIIFSNSFHAPINYELFTNGDKAMVGIGDSTTCDNFILDPFGDMPHDLYVCWSDQPDGIIVNGVSFEGNAMDCFGGILDYESYGTNLYKNPYTLLLYYRNDFDFRFYERIGESQATVPSVGANHGPLESSEITSIVIRDHGKVLVSFTADDLELISGGYQIKDAEKKQLVLDYLESIDNACNSL